MPLPTPDSPSPQQRIQAEYTHYYQYYNADSHPSQRTIIIEQIHKLIESKEKTNPEQKGEPTPLRILDIGSGPQVLERELFAKYPELKGVVSIITLDIASIQSIRLEARLPHTQADAAHLPFKNSSFDLVISNMALDFVAPQGDKRREQLFQEIYRVLKPEGKLIATLHHPSLEIDYYTYQHTLTRLTTQNQKLQKEIKATSDEERIRYFQTLIQQNKIAINDAWFRYWMIHKYVFKGTNDIIQFVQSLRLRGKREGPDPQHAEELPLFKIIRVEEQHEDREKWFYVELEKGK